MFKGIGKGILKAFTWMKPFLKVGLFLGRLAAKATLIIPILTGLWGTITGAIAGYKTGGFLGAVKGGLQGLFAGLLGELLDDMKAGVHWLLVNLFKVDENAGWMKALDEFSFVDKFGKILDWFEEMYYGFKDIWGNVKGWLENNPALTDAWTAGEFNKVIKELVKAALTSFGFPVETVTKGAKATKKTYELWDKYMNVPGIMQRAWDGLKDMNDIMLDKNDPKNDTSRKPWEASPSKKEDSKEFRPFASPTGASININKGGDNFNVVGGSTNTVTNVIAGGGLNLGNMSRSFNA
jgi:hypothetical protein